MSDIRVIVGKASNVYTISPDGPYQIPGIKPESLESAIKTYLGVESPDSPNSRTYHCQRDDGTGVRVHVRGSDREPYGQVCNGRY